MKQYERKKLLGKANKFTSELSKKRVKPNKTKQDISEIINILHKLVDLDCAAGVLGAVQSHLEELPRWYRKIGEVERAAEYTDEYIMKVVGQCEAERGF